jgi:hypothetical protein
MPGVMSQESLMMDLLGFRHAHLVPGHIVDVYDKLR